VGPFLDGFDFYAQTLQTMSAAGNEILLYLDYWFMRRRALNVFPYLSLCKMKRPHFWANFILTRKF